ncbi:MAG TPA: hypothetical protein VNO52_11035, partial [Methylomirabilota bacterium]|nr:hypothetical protein [Methylomirabilota bacterium]
MSRRIGLLLLGLTGTASSLRACDLCAIYNANNARSSRSAVFGLTVAEQYVPYNTPSLDGREVSVADPDALNESITHLVPGFNISPRFGVGLNVPVVHRTFRRTALEVAPDHSTRIVQESGTVFGLGDVSLVGRLTVLELSEMNRGLSLNLLAGVKVPTGDSDRLE